MEEPCSALDCAPRRSRSRPALVERSAEIAEAISAVSRPQRWPPTSGRATRGPAHGRPAVAPGRRDAARPTTARRHCRGSTSPIQATERGGAGPATRPAARSVRRRPVVIASSSCCPRRHRRTLARRPHPPTTAGARSRRRRPLRSTFDPPALPRRRQPSRHRRPRPAATPRRGGGASRCPSAPASARPAAPKSGRRRRSKHRRADAEFYRKECR